MSGGNAPPIRLFALSSGAVVAVEGVIDGGELSVRAGGEEETAVLGADADVECAGGHVNDWGAPDIDESVFGGVVEGQGDVEGFWAEMFFEGLDEFLVVAAGVEKQDLLLGLAALGA